MKILIYALIALAGYLLGSVNVSILFSKAIGIDVRKKGSGNAGATNMTRNFGWAAGLLTLLGDFAKAAVALELGKLLAGDVGIAIGGIAAILGHCYPVYFHFKGGKGISVGAAIGLWIDWRVFVGIVVVFLIVALLSKKVSLGSLWASLAIAVFAIVFAVSVPKLVLACFAGALAIFQHRSNLMRLIRGIEPDFKAARRWHWRKKDGRDE